MYYIPRGGAGLACIPSGPGDIGIGDGGPIVVGESGYYIYVYCT